MKYCSKSRGVTSQGINCGSKTGKTNRSNDARRHELLFLRSSLAALAFLLFTASLWAEHIPETGGLGLDYQGRLAVMADIEDLNPYLELQGKLEGSEIEFRYRALTAGLYWRALKNLKIGGLYRLQAGVRHDDDWLDLGGGEWGWADTRDRYEHVTIVDATPRFLLGRSGVAAGKIRYEYNLTNQQQILLLRPGYTWFHMVDRQARWNLAINYALYFSLNFGDTLLYEHGPYISFLYHLGDLLKLELRADYSTRIWSAGEDSIAAGDSWQVEERRVFAGIGLIFMPRF